MLYIADLVAALPQHLRHAFLRTVLRTQRKVLHFHQRGGGAKRAAVAEMAAKKVVRLSPNACDGHNDDADRRWRLGTLRDADRGNQMVRLRDGIPWLVAIP
jgi:hypothetical protein